MAATPKPKKRKPGDFAKEHDRKTKKWQSSKEYKKLKEREGRFEQRIRIPD